jgi:uncharacterized membrane protein
MESSTLISKKSPETPSWWTWFRTTFTRGFGVMVPVVITIWVINLLFNAFDGFIAPLLESLLGRRIPGLGLLSMIVLILIVGVLSRNLVGRMVFKFFEQIITSIPFARTIYSAVKDLMRAFAIGSKSRTFREVVLLEYPRIGLYSIGFVTNEVVVHGPDGESIAMVNIYFPHPPNPTSGVMIVAPRKAVHVVNISVEEGLKLVLSGGIVSPAELTTSREEAVKMTDK